MKTYTKGQMAKAYGINYRTFINWLKDIPELTLNPKQRILKPKQIEIIYHDLGEPKDFNLFTK